MATYYVDANNTTGTASDANSGLTSALAWRTLSKLNADANAGKVNGDIINLAGTFREKLKFRPANDVTIRQWAGMPQCVIRGDTIPTWISDGTGLFHVTLPDAPNTTGETDGMSDYVASVVYNWELSIDSLGRHYGHLTRAASAAAVTGGASGDYTYFYTPGTKRLDVRLTTGDDSTLCAWCRGNVDGIELGTPSYASFPAHNSIQSAATLGTFSTPVYRLTIDGIHAYLWCDSGFGNRASTISIGYGIRVADGVGCVVKNCTTIDTGYHAMMFVGDCCYGNTNSDCVYWGGAPNSSSGNSFGTFYSGPGGGLFPTLSNVDKCVARNLTGYKYWHLGVNGNPLALDAARVTTVGDASTNPVTCDGFINHCNNRGATFTAAASGTGGVARFTTSAAHNMFTGEMVNINNSSVGGYNGSWSIVATDSTHFEITGAYTSTATGNWYSESNRVLDAKFYNCKVIESGKISDNTMCYGNAFVAGSRCKAPTDELDYNTYPVQFHDCEVVNGSRNLSANTDAVAFIRTRFSMPRAGIGAFTVTGASLTGVMGSTSADAVTFARQMYIGCEIPVNLTNSTLNRALFQLNTAFRLFLINCGVYDLSTRLGAGTATNTNALFGGAGATSNLYVYARNSILGFRNNRGSNAQYLTFGPQAAWCLTTNCDFESCWYVNVSSGSYNPFDGVGTQSNTQALWTANVDPTGNYTNDVTAAMYAPFLDPNAGDMRLSGYGQSLQTTTFPRIDVGLGGQSNGGQYGPRQYGGTPATAKRLSWRVR